MAPISMIPKRAFQVSSGILVGLVLIAAAARIAILIKKRHRIYLSDAFLLLACVCLCAGTVLLYWMFDSLYLMQAVYNDPSSVVLPSNFLQQVSSTLKLLFTYQTIVWTSIYAIKFSFLAFFRPLLIHLEGLKIWWNCVTVLTAVSWAFAGMGAFVICPYFDLRAMTCAIVPLNPRPQPIFGTVIGLDVLTDIMIISIPVILLWNAKLKRRQRFWLLATLCLSIAMVVIGLVRVSAAPRPNKIQDVPYAVFLQQLEGCVAIIMASASAFRSLFATEGSRAPKRTPKFVMTANRKMWNRRKHMLSSESDRTANGLPSIPSATITGLRTFINGGSRHSTSISNFEQVPEDWPMTSVKKPETLHTREASEYEASYSGSGSNTAFSPSGESDGSHGREWQSKMV